MEILMKQGQWLGDVAIQQNGTFESVFDIAVQNDQCVDAEMEIGSVLFVQPLVATTAEQSTYTRVAQYYDINNIYPATNTNMMFGGIGYMGIEINFIVS